VQAIIRELRGEKIDIIEHSDDLVTFAQSALAPAKITRVAVRHEGEVPHLDVIVEDAQLSLAIGKRGQNVRLASELIGCRIDIKSESAVKDEVADALAALLQVGAEEEETAASTPIDLTEAPGIGEKTAERLTAAGYGTLESLLSASQEELAAVNGVSARTAASLTEWAQTRQEPAPEEAAAAQEGLAAPAEPTSRTMGDDDFMAALSRAFEDLDRTTAAGEGEAGDEETETTPS
jgi:N utilization substance protein A